jgi:hypothetical protein
VRAPQEQRRSGEHNSKPNRGYRGKAKRDSAEILEIFSFASSIALYGNNHFRIALPRYQLPSNLDSTPLPLGLGIRSQKEAQLPLLCEPRQCTTGRADPGTIQLRSRPTGEALLGDGIAPQGVDRNSR